MVIQKFGFKFDLFLYLALMPVIEKKKSTSQMYVEPIERNNIITLLITLS